MAGSGIPVVTLYTKNYCSLCVQAKAVIDSVRNDAEFVLETIDITQDQDLYTKYITEIPVVYVNGDKAFKYRVNRELLLEILQRCTLE